MLPCLRHCACGLYRLWETWNIFVESPGDPENVFWNLGRFGGYCLDPPSEPENVFLSAWMTRTFFVGVSGGLAEFYLDRLRDGGNLLEASRQASRYTQFSSL